MALAPAIFVAMLLVLLLQLVQSQQFMGIARFGRPNDVSTTQNDFLSHPSDLCFDIIWFFRQWGSSLKDSCPCDFGRNIKMFLFHLVQIFAC